MKRFIIKNKTFFNILVALVNSIVLGIYLSLVSNFINEGVPFFQSLIRPACWWLYVLIFALATVVQIYIELFVEKKGHAYKLELINSVLKSACNSFIYPEKHHIRAIITVCDYKTQTRKTVYSYNIESSPERHGKYDLYFGVTGEAIKKKIPVAKELASNHVETYDEATQNKVKRELRCVLAAPIFSVKDDDKVIGVLAFDSTESLATMKFDQNESIDLAQSWADIISKILDE